MSDEPVSLSDLKAKRAAMTQGEWWQDLDSNDQQVINTDSLWIALLPHQCVASIEQEQECNATGIVATHNAADVLIEIAEAVHALRKAYGAPAAEREALEALWRASHKIRP